MTDFSNIIQEINTNLPDNTEQLITPEILRNTLIDFVNKVEDSDGDLETAIQNKQDTLTFDATPTENSANPVTSGGIYDSLSNKTDKVQNAIAGNFAGLDSNGNITDSGSKASDFATIRDIDAAINHYSPTFVCTYGRTTYADIIAEYSNGKRVVVDTNGRIAELGLVAANRWCIFFRILTDASNNIVIHITTVTSGDRWSEEEITLENVSDKVSSIVGYENNIIKYPNTKAVADALADYVKKSQTAGLLKNDGTVDTNTYLTQQDIADKADKTTVTTLSDTIVTQELTDNTIYQCSTLDSLTITMPNNITPDYISQINFTSGTTATTFTAPNTIVWYGDDLSNNVFVPTAGKQYVVIFYYDGTNVRSIVQSN